MPVIHAPLNDDDFVDLSNMARRKGMTRSALASYILIAEIRKEVKQQSAEEEALKETMQSMTRREAMEFNKQGLPLAKKSALASVISAAAIRRAATEHEKEIATTSADGTPRIPMYERGD